jgi:MinD superfamily P-loop ATPase
VKKITIVSGKGGVGKSMLASSLAVLLAREKKIIAVDCDVDAPMKRLNSQMKNALVVKNAWVCAPSVQSVGIERRTSPSLTGFSARVVDPVCWFVLPMR